MEQFEDFLNTTNTLTKVPGLKTVLKYIIRVIHLISNALNNPWRGKHILARPLSPHITYVFNEEQLSFSSRQRIPFHNRFLYELRQFKRLVYVFWIALIGLLVAKHRWLVAIVLFSLVSFVYRQNRSQSRNRNIRRCFRLLMNNPDSLAAFQKRIGAPTMLRMRQEQMWDERADWLNDLVIKFWPYVNSLIQNEIDKQKMNEIGFMTSNGRVIYLERFTDRKSVV